MIIAILVYEKTISFSVPVYEICSLTCYKNYWNLSYFGYDSCIIHQNIFFHSLKHTATIIPQLTIVQDPFHIIQKSDETSIY